MNYQEINNAILQGKDVDLAIVRKDEKFYEYIKNNKVAYYYASALSKHPTNYEHEILKVKESYDKEFHKTLQFLDALCKKNGLKYLLYKTYKFIPDIYDGDIDIIVRGNDFSKVMNLLKAEGFHTIEDEPGKGKCTKNGYKIIEPHISISWRGINYINEDLLWKDCIDVRINGSNYKNVSKNIETIAVLAKIIYEPSYLDLYSCKFIKNQKATIKKLPKPLRIVALYSENIFREKEVKYPAFLDNLTFTKLWASQALKNKKLWLFVLHEIYFLYWKYRYKLFNKLPFTHHADWKIKI